MQAENKKYNKTIDMKIKAALFDLDGVVFDTESQYSVFWGMIGKEYHPEMADFAQRIKGQTLVQIYDKYFSDEKCFSHIENRGSAQEEQAKITARLNEFEQNMDYPYILGFEKFVSELRANHVKCAVVTSSNMPKMLNVYKKHPEFTSYFDRVLTSEDFSKSKPDPDCYLKAAACFGVSPQECVGLEDSFNGLRSVRDSGAYTLGLATTNPAEQIAPYSDAVIKNYEDFTYDKLCQLFMAKQ